MGGDNAYDASEATDASGNPVNYGKQRARKGYRFKKFPPIVTMQMKRFLFDLETLDMAKINSMMRFPKRLDLSEFVPKDDGQQTGDTASGGSSEHIYTLYGVTIHTGTIGSGHYYAFLRPFIEDEESAGLLNWIRFDD